MTRFSQHTEEGFDFVRSPDPVSKGRGGSNRLLTLITLDAAKHFSMLEKNERGKATRRYFIEMESGSPFAGISPHQW